MKPIGLPEHRLRQVVELEAAEAIAARKLLHPYGSAYRYHYPDDRDEHAGAKAGYYAARAKAERARADYERGEQ